VAAGAAGWPAGAGPEKLGAGAGECNAPGGTSRPSGPRGGRRAQANSAVNTTSETKVSPSATEYAPVSIMYFSPVLIHDCR